jgi:hypothetical protein
MCRQLPHASAAHLLLLLLQNAVVILAAMLLFAEEVTLLQAVGYIVSTAAFGVYTHIKMTQIANEAAQPDKPGKT